MRRFCQQLSICVLVLMASVGCTDTIDDLLGIKGREALPNPQRPAIAELKDATVTLAVDNLNPKQVGTQSNWKAVALGSQHMLALNAAGTLFAGLLPTSQQDNVQIHLVPVMFNLPAAQNVKIRFSATHVCVGFSSGRLFCGPLFNNSLRPVQLTAVTGGTNAQQWDLKSSALCVLTTGGSLACTRLSHDAAQTPRVRREADQKEWSGIQVGSDGVCATHEQPSGDRELFCGMLPKDNAEAVKLARASGNVKWEAGGFRVEKGFFCGRSATGLYCGLLPTNLGQSPKVTQVSVQAAFDQKDLFAMGTSSRDRVRLCVYLLPKSPNNPSQLRCTVLEAKGDNIKTPVTLNQAGTGGPPSTDSITLYLEGNYAWIAPDGAISALGDNTRQVSLYRANVGVQGGDLLSPQSVTRAASLYWSRVFPLPRGHAYVLEKSAAADSQHNLWAIPANKGSASQIEQPQNQSESAWHYDANSPSFAVNAYWACGLRREGTTSRSNSLWCWRHGQVKR